MADVYYYVDDAGQQQGPIAVEEVAALIRRGTVRPETLIWTAGMSDWLRADAVAAVAAAFPARAAPPPVRPRAAATTAPAAGALTGANQQFCSSCGQIISNLASSCPHCGAPTGAMSAPANASPKSRLAALLLCWFFGVFGVHRFYVGKIGTGLLQLITFGGLCIWVIIDLIVIIVGSFKDKAGRPIVIWLR